MDSNKNTHVSNLVTGKSEQEDGLEAEPVVSKLQEMSNPDNSEVSKDKISGVNTKVEDDHYAELGPSQLEETNQSKPSNVEMVTLKSGVDGEHKAEPNPRKLQKSQSRTSSNSASTTKLETRSAPANLDYGSGSLYPDEYSPNPYRPCEEPIPRTESKSCWITPCKTALQASKQMISISKTRVFSSSQKPAKILPSKPQEENPASGVTSQAKSTTKIGDIHLTLQDPDVAEAILGKRAASEKFGRSVYSSDGWLGSEPVSDVWLNVDLDDFALFIGNCRDRYLALRKTYLKTNELSQFMGYEDIVLSDDVSPRAPPLRFWFVTLIRLMHSVTTTSSKSLFMDGKIIRNYHKEIRKELKATEKDIKILDEEMTRFQKCFHKFQDDFRRRARKISTKISYYCRPELINEWKATFNKLKDTDIAKGTYGLSPTTSSTRNEQDPASTEYLIHDPVDRDRDIIYGTTVKDTGELLVRNFEDMANIYRMEVVLKFLTKFHEHIRDIKKLAKEASSAFTKRTRSKKSCKSVCKLEEQLSEMHRFVKKSATLWYPPQISRCLFQLWLSKIALDKLESILQPLQRFVSSFKAVWNDIFKKPKRFTFEGYNTNFIDILMKIPNEWTPDKRRFIFDLSDKNNNSLVRNSCDYAVVAPDKSEECAPLLFQLLTNTLAGLIDYDHEYETRVDRQFRDQLSQYPYHEDIHLCCVYIEHLYLNTAVIATTFKNFMNEMRDVDFRTFGRLISVANYASPYSNGFGHIPVSIPDNGHLLKYWMVLCCKCLEQSSSLVTYEANLSKLEECFDLFNKWLKGLERLFQRVNEQFTILCQVVTYFEKEKILFPCLMKLEQFNLDRPVIGSVLLTPVEVLHTYRKAREYMVVSNDILIAQVNDDEINFNLPDRHLEIPYTAITESRMKEEILSSFLATTKELVSSKLELLDCYEEFIYNERAGNQERNTWSLGQLVDGVTYILNQPNSRMLMCLDLLVAIRSLRLVHNALHNFLNVIRRKLLIYNKLSSSFHTAIKNLRKKKTTKFGDWIPHPESIALCYFNLHHAKLVKECKLPKKHAEVPQETTESNVPESAES